MPKVRSVCNLCPSLCGLEIEVDGGKILRLKGDKNSPISRGFLCRKGKALLEYAACKERILHPLKRVDKAGSIFWERISWDEAFDIIVSELKRVRSDYGPESVLFIRGAASGLADILLTRLAYAFGSPNVTSMGFLCFMPRVYASYATFGSFLLPDYDHPPKTIVLWGINPYATYPYIHQKVLSAKRRGSKIIIIDPFETHLVKIADLWLKLRPGSDLLLCLSMLYVVINENLYDRTFVERWTYGFDKLKDFVMKFPPEKTERYTYVKPHEIRAFLEIYIQNRPASIVEGNALDQGVNPFLTLRAIYVLEAISGNIGVPGGKIRYKNPNVVKKYGPSFTLRNLLPKDAKGIGYELLAPFVHYALPQAVVKSLIEGSDNSPKAAFVMRGNVVLTWPDTKKTLEALKRLKFLFVSDQFLTPTSALANVILPAATCLEYDSICLSPDFPFLVHAQRKVVEFGEAKSDLWIINELGKRLGLQEYFFEDEYALFDEILKDDGLTFEELKKKNLITGEKEYMFFEKDGFNTESRKVEIYSESLKSYGYDPLFDFDDSVFEQDDHFPYVLTSYKPRDFRHTNFRQIESIRKRNPYPNVFLNSKTAKKLGIKENQWVFVSTKTGQIKGLAKLMDRIHETLVVVEHGWWLPEDEDSYLELNINVLTSIENTWRITGSPMLRGIPCNVRHKDE